MIEYYSGFMSGIAQIIIGYPMDTIIVYKQTGLDINDIKFKNIYKGIQYPLFTYGLISSLCFGINNNIYQYINNHFLSGGITGLITSIIISPIELYKIRSQKLKKNNVNPFVGLKVTSTREFISSSLYFGLYNTLIDNNINTFISGGITGCISWISSYPIDVIKTRIQSGECKTITESIQMKNLWRGISVCLYKAFIVNAIGFYTYEKSKKYFVQKTS